MNSHATAGHVRWRVRSRKNGKLPGFGSKSLTAVALLVSLASLAGCSMTSTTYRHGISASKAQPSPSIPAQQQAARYSKPLTMEDRTLLAETSLFDSRGLRSDRYRAPVPSQAPGAITLTDKDFIALKKLNQLLLIDVLPAALHEGRFINTKQHKTIPGSFWLANTGKADAPEPINHYFQKHLLSLMAQFPGKTPVFFCKTDCWMSWNAAAKAHQLGISKLYWYPSGTDGWQEHGGELVLQAPVPLEESGTQ